MGQKPPSKDVDYRSAVSGRFVKESYAKSHPSTTVKETNKPKSTPSKKGK
jgi:hypothetical protein